MISDTEILQRFKKNRQDGIQILFGRYYRPLVLYADDFVHSLPIAEDIVQEFFIRLWTDDYLENLAPRTLSSYLFTAVRNSCYTHGHRRDIWSRKGYLATETDIPTETALKMEQGIVERVELAIARLPEQTRGVITRILVDEMKYKEAAAELNISVNTLKTLLRGGLKTLRAELKEEYRSFIVVRFRNNNKIYRCLLLYLISIDYLCFLKRISTIVYPQNKRTFYMAE